MRYLKCGGWGAFFLGLMFCLSPLPAQVFEGQTLVRAELISSKSAFVPGQPLEVGLLLEMAPGWHSYWENSGDAGLPTKIAWSLPPGFASGPIQWPVPSIMIEPGDIWTYGYGGKVLLITTIVPPLDLAVGATITIRAKATWLVCKEICVPGSGELELKLPVAKVAPAANAGIFAEFQSQIPSAGRPAYALEWRRDAGLLELKIPDLPAGKKALLFPLPAEGQKIGHPESRAANAIAVPVGGNFRGILAVEEGDVRQAWVVEENVPAAPGPPTPTPTPPIGLSTALLYGLLGGMILNLMPCVLPVISLKIFGFMKQAGESPGKIFAHGLAFTGGIFAWFLGLGLLVVALKSGGSEVTWAFQFQNPWFNVAVGTLVFVFALNLFGVFELVLPGRAGTAMESAGSSEGLSGSFFQGVFATLLATPCTAPFLGSSLGFAFSQPAPVVLAIFGSVATGMALPYLLLSARPGWMKFLPRPGAWMERLKQFMGFPLLATLIWILGILGTQRGIAGILWFSSFLLCLAFACWIYGAFCGPLAPPRARVAALLAIGIVALGGGGYFLGEKFANAGQKDSNAIAWVAFSETDLAALQAEKKSVFLDFTAEWCITCKFNERTAIGTPAVRDLLRAKGVVPMRADWTNANPEITKALKKFGRVGVPFYVVYPAGRADDPIILPELLTEAILVDALSKLP